MRPVFHRALVQKKLRKPGVGEPDVSTDKGNVNRQIAADNKLLKEIKARMTRLYNWSKEQAVPVLMTNFSKILNSLSGMFSEDRNKYLASFHHFILLIIADLGIEHNSEYALEQVYNIVGSRYLSRLPFIITTNLPLAELQAPRDLAHARIYDRVLEHCTPICFNGPNYRKGNAAATTADGRRDGPGNSTPARLVESVNIL